MHAPLARAPAAAAPGFCGCCFLYNGRGGGVSRCPFYGGGAPEETAAVTSDHRGASTTTAEASPDDEDDELP